MSEKLSNSLNLLDEFEKAVLIPKNNKNVLKFIERINADLEKYNHQEVLKEVDLDINNNKTKIKNIINRIDNLNKIVLPKSKLGNEFLEQNALK